MSGDDEAASEDEEEWRYSLADLEEAEDAEAAEEDGDDGGNIAGSLVGRDPIEPGDVDLENAVFVALGVLFAALVVLGFAINLT